MSKEIQDEFDANWQELASSINTDGMTKEEILDWANNCHLQALGSDTEDEALHFEMMSGILKSRVDQDEPQCVRFTDPKYKLNLATAVLHISKGNSKLGKGIYAFGTLPGNKDHMLYLNSTGELLTDIPGTCSKYCEGCAKDGECYAWRDCKLHHNVVIKAMGDNTLLLRARTVFDMIDNFITDKNKKYYETKDEKDIAVRMFRINTSGEIEGMGDLLQWNSIAKKHPEVYFGIYTKNFDALEAYLTVGCPADNFCINVSQWHHVADDFLAKHPDELNVFEYDDSNCKSCTMSEEDKDRLSKMQHCPAVTKTGHHAVNAKGEPITCDKCGRCYGKRGICVTAVWSH